MDRSAVGTTISLEQQGSWKTIEIPRHIPMAPQSWAPAPRTPGRTGPQILLPYFFQKLDIDMKIQYQRNMSWRDN
jgi:hypothetical protein